MRILFVHNLLQSFARTDRDILAEAHEITELDLSNRMQVAALPYYIARTDLIYVWFAGLHALPPVLMAALVRKPSIVVVGGYDTACEPAIGYGHMAHPWKRYVVRTICARASLLIANSETAHTEVQQNTGTRTPIVSVYHGFEPVARPCEQKEPLALTVGTVSRLNLTRKGHAVFAHAAPLLPGVRFVLAGRQVDDTADLLLTGASKNLEVRGFLSETELSTLFDRAGVYVQASKHEGFGSAVAEAMQRGCIPVVSRCGALPEVVGDTGIYVDEDDPASVADGIGRGLRASDDARHACVRRVETMFPMDRRRAALLSLVESVRG